MASDSHSAETAPSSRPGEAGLPQGDGMETFLALNQAAWGRFTARREWEYKVTLSIWTALAAALYEEISVERDLPVLPPEGLSHAGYIVGFLVFVLAITFVYAFYRWCLGMQKAYDADKFCAIDYERALNEHYGFRFSAKTEDQFKRINETRTFGLDYSLFLPFLITALLVLAAVWIGWRLVAAL
ncbi:MAG TPA: hypothetical protein VL860_11930 [Planctomycetota bacterium]|nr:hypothetical protein [Planctomycetota bacterium]